MAPLLATLQSQRSKLKAKAGKDELCAKGVAEIATMIDGLDKFLEKVGDTIAANELVAPDEPDDKVLQHQAKELDSLHTSAEQHLDGAKRAKARFQGMIG